MSVFTPIQWCDSAVNPVMACDDQCEMWPNTAELAGAIIDELSSNGYTCAPLQRRKIKKIVGVGHPSDIYNARKIIAFRVVEWFPTVSETQRNHIEECISRAIAATFKCYAGLLHLRHGANKLKPKKRVNAGYARTFEKSELFAGRMKAAANWSDLNNQAHIGKPWLAGLPRLIFVSDMGDALGAGVPFNYLEKEIIENVRSAEGRRHLWLWLTKQPRRMAQFSDQLLGKGITWPENLVAMTSVTSQKTAGRVAQLKKVPSRFHGLSIEPLWTEVSLDLNGIDWVIVGGESANPRRNAEPFDIAWARDLHAQCRRANVAFFVKQLGSRPVENGEEMKLVHNHGDDWDEWAADLRIREIPNAFRSIPLNEPL